MKKILAIGGIVFVLMLAACSEGEQTTSTEKNNTTIKESGKKNAEKESTKKEAKVEVVQETFSAWKDSIDTVWVNYAAEVKNNGTAPANLSDIQINFEGKNGDVLGTAEMVTVVPDVLMPGEVAYITESTTLDAVKDAKLVTKAYANVDFKTGNEKPYYLKTEKVLLKPNNQKFLEDQPYIVTGTVKNEGKEKADDIRIAAGLYDEKGKLVAVLEKSIDVSLNTGGKTAFQLDYPNISPDIKGKAKTVKVVAHNWDMGF